MGGRATFTFALTLMKLGDLKKANTFIIAKVEITGFFDMK